MASSKLSSKTIRAGKRLVFRVVPTNGIDNGTVNNVSQIDDLITIEAYEGYRKLGRFKLSDAKLKFR